MTDPDLPVPHKYWIQTYGGHAFDLMLQPAGQLRIEVIAHHLARICRFAGATREHYSVAQHCVHVSELVPSRLARRGLLHDAHEFALGDTPGPLLALLRFHVNGVKSVVDYYRDQTDRAIAKAFHVDYPIMTHEISRADLLMLAAEKRDLLEPEPQPWPGLDRVDAKELAAIPTITPWPFEVAKARFLEVFDMPGGAQ